MSNQLNLKLVFDKQKPLTDFNNRNAVKEWFKALIKNEIEINQKNQEEFKSEFDSFEPATTYELIEEIKSLVEADDGYGYLQFSCESFGNDLDNKHEFKKYAIENF